MPLPGTIALDVSPGRLHARFSLDGDRYRINKDLRELVLFATHDVLRDPPFSKLDLISCRNLLIYLDRQMQDRTLEIFHFALRRHGYLLPRSRCVGDILRGIANYRVIKRRVTLPFDRRLATAHA